MRLFHIIDVKFLFHLPISCIRVLNFSCHMSVQPHNGKHGVETSRAQPQKCLLQHLSKSTLPSPPTLGSHWSEQQYTPQPAFYGQSQCFRRNVWGPRHNFLIFFYKLVLFFVQSCDFEARGGPQGEAGGPWGRISDFSLCPLHILSGRHQQRCRWALLQGAQLLHGWRGQTSSTSTGNRYLTLKRTAHTLCRWQ